VRHFVFPVPLGASKSGTGPRRQLLHALQRGRFADRQVGALQPAIRDRGRRCHNDSMSGIFLLFLDRAGHFQAVEIVHRLVEIRLEFALSLA